MTAERKTALSLVALLAFFALSLSAAMYATYLQENKAGVLTSATIATLKENYGRDPKSEGLKEAIRQLDVQLREDYYRSRRQLTLGAYLLIAGLIGALAAARWFIALAPARAPEELLGTPGVESPARNAWSAALVTAMMLAGLAGLALFMKSGLPPAGGLPAASGHNAPRAQALPPIAATQAIATPSTPSTGEVKASPPPPTSAPSAFKDNWPGFRGPDGIGVVPAGAAGEDFPTTWSAATGRNIVWKCELPVTGKSSPVVWGDRIFLSGGDEKEQRLIAIDRAGGKLLWNVRVPAPPGAETITVAEDTGFAAPTPVSDGKAVYAMFATGALAALDFEGHPLWVKQFGKPESAYGLAASLLFYQNTLLVQLDQGGEPGKSRIMGLDPANGNIRWSTPRPVPNSWASPALVRAPAGVMLVTCANPNVIAYDPASGKELWKVEGLGGDMAPSPAYGGGLVFAANAGSELLAIKPGPPAQIVWKCEDGLPDIASPVSDGQRVLLAVSGGQLTCLAAQTGEKLWEKSLECSLSASPIVAGKLTYLAGQDGVTRVLELADEFRQRGRGDVGEPLYATPAFGDGRIYLRGEKHLFCIGGKP